MFDKFEVLMSWNLSWDLSFLLFGVSDGHIFLDFSNYCLYVFHAYWFVQMTPFVIFSVKGLALKRGDSKALCVQKAYSYGPVKKKVLLKRKKCVFQYNLPVTFQFWFTKCQIWSIPRLGAVWVSITEGKVENKSWGSSQLSNLRCRKQD